MYLGSVSVAFKYLVVSLFLVSITGFVYDDEGCRTPDRRVGNCIVARKCQSLTNFLRRVPKPLSPYIKGKLRGYICGYKGRRTKFCCPKVINIPFIKGRPSTSNNSHGIKNKIHKNLHLLPRECGRYVKPSEHPYTSNGREAELGQFPWMALLSYNTSKGPVFKCGGTIINDRYILTAAHCIKNLKQPLLGVRVGEYDIVTNIDCDLFDKKRCAPPVQDLKIEEIIPHPRSSFTATDSNNLDRFKDIGLLRVSKIKFSEYVRPICLPTEETKTAKRIESLAVMSGWGFTHRGSYFNIMRKVDASLIGREECQMYFKGLGIKVSELQICTKGSEMHSYRGDSGGPLQVIVRFNNEIRSILYGVISVAESTYNFIDYPGISTRVYLYMDWILDNIRK